MRKVRMKEEKEVRKELILQRLWGVMVLVSDVTFRQERTLCFLNSLSSFPMGSL